MSCIPCRKGKKYNVERVEELCVSTKKESNVKYSKHDEKVSFVVPDTQKTINRFEVKEDSNGWQVYDRVDSRQKADRLKKDNRKQEYGSVLTTSDTSKFLGLEGTFEDINDEVNNSRLAQRFESLYSQKWVLLIKWMVKNCQSMPEVDRISLVTKLMKSGYTKCKASADGKLCNLLDIESIKDIRVNENVLNAKQKRKKDCIEGTTKQRIVKDITDYLLHIEDKAICTLCSGGNSDDAYTKLQTYLEEYIECCWLMSVTIPTMVLDFNVVGKLYTDCEEHFKVYSTKLPVEDLTKAEGEICEVVWPCVKLEDESSAIYMKGDVIVVKHGKEVQ